MIYKIYDCTNTFCNNDNVWEYKTIDTNKTIDVDFDCCNAEMIADNILNALHMYNLMIVTGDTISNVNIDLYFEDDILISDYNGIPLFLLVVKD